MHDIQIHVVLFMFALLPPPTNMILFVSVSDVSEVWWEGGKDLSRSLVP